MNLSRQEALLAEARAASERHQAQSLDVLKVTPVEGGELAAPLSGSCSHDQVVVTSHLACCLRLRPDARVFPRDLIRVGNDWEEFENRFQISLAAWAVFGAGALHAMPQLGERDGGNFDFLGCVLSEPSARIESALLAPNDDIRIEDYRHLSSGALKDVRDCRRSSTHARASSGERSVVASARASSAPVQRDTAVGTSRATGVAASRTTNVVCSRRARATHLREAGTGALQRDGSFFHDSRIPQPLPSCQARRSHPMNESREEALFAFALEKPADKRAAFLDGVCHGDPALRQRMEALLAAHDAEDSLLAEPPSAKGRAATIKLDLADDPLTKPWARRSAATSCWRNSAKAAAAWSMWPSRREPVRRRVALKVIKLGMDTKQVVARFEAERQALAMMDHPNIAKVLDAGATDTGRPYFVMELVRGIQITEYCDQNQPHHQGTARSVHQGLPGHPARASEGHHPPRHQALEHPRDAARRRAGAQGDRLRHRQGDGRAADRQDGLHAVAPVHRHAGLHESGAGGDERAGHRYAQRHLQPGRAALRTADRQHAVRCEGTDGRRASTRCARRSARRSRCARARAWRRCRATN